MFDAIYYPILDKHRKVIEDLHDFLSLGDAEWWYQATIHSRIFWVEFRSKRVAKSFVAYLVEIPGLRWFEATGDEFTISLEH